MVRLQSPDSRYFEEVLFLLRDEPAARAAREGDILCEANRILEESTAVRPPRRRSAHSVLPFLMGAIVGAAAVLPVLFL